MTVNYFEMYKIMHMTSQMMGFTQCILRVLKCDDIWKKIITTLKLLRENLGGKNGNTVAQLWL